MVKQQIDIALIAKVKAKIKSKYKVLSTFDVEDIMQDSVLQLLAKYPNVANENDFCSLLYVIARNKSITAIQNMKKCTNSYNPAQSEEVKYEIDYNEIVRKEVESLPKKYKEVIELYYFEEKKFREIAEILGANENTIKTRAQRALKRIRCKINK